MSTIEFKLKERIKELTCLYEVTSIIVNADYDALETSMEAIAHSLKRAWQHEKEARVILNSKDYFVVTDKDDPKEIFIRSEIKVFNKIDGFVQVGYPIKLFAITDFLAEERKLLDNVALALGNLLERKQIRDSEATVRLQIERTDRLHILGEITAGIAHELNTPLANILGFTELLTENIGDKAAVRDLKKIMDNAIFCREIVKKLMFFTCEMPHEMIEVHLNPIVENVLKLLGPSLLEKNIRLTKLFSKADIMLRTDAVQITQVLFNLIMNAVYYSPTGGQVKVIVDEISEKIQIKISDEGPGIDPKNAARIFEPFFTTKPLGEGSGLGLSVVHGIISSHQGSISHQANSPLGSVFIVNFPKL